VRERARALARPLGWAAIALVIGFIVWTRKIAGGPEVPEPVQVLALIAVIFAARLTVSEHDGWAFIASAVAIAASVGSIFIDLYPNVMVSSTKTAYNLTVHNAASGGYALKLMTIVVVIFLPLVLLYQGWSFHVFRGRLTGPPAEEGPQSPVASPAPQT
jgi:cytochrome d ubiquinol oxidase subunit II